MGGEYTDYYDVLGVGEDASQKQVEDARKKRLKETHPDVGGERDEFLLIKEAYDVLGNAKTRSQYDRLGHSEYINKYDGTELHQNSGSTADNNKAGSNNQSKTHNKKTNTTNKRRRDKQRKTSTKQKNNTNTNSRTSENKSKRNSQSNSTSNTKTYWNDLSDEELLNTLQNMDPYDFEHFVADLWGYHGYDTDVTSGSNDGGLDILARKSEPFEQVIAIQAKRYNEGNNVGGPDIQQYSALLHQYEDVNGVVIVTTSDFTSDAKKRANDLDLQLVSGTEIIQDIRSNNAYNLFRKYINHNRSWDSNNTDAKSDYSRTRNKQNKTASDGTSFNLSVDGIIDHFQGNRIRRVIVSSSFYIFFIILIISDVITNVYTDTTLAASYPEGSIITIATLSAFCSVIYVPYAVWIDSRYSKKKYNWPNRRWFYIAGSSSLTAFTMYIFTGGETTGTIFIIFLAIIIVYSAFSVIMYSYTRAKYELV